MFSPPLVSLPVLLLAVNSATQVSLSTVDASNFPEGEIMMNVYDLQLKDNGWLLLFN
jgi:hypothetical protein